MRTRLAPLSMLLAVAGHVLPVDAQDRAAGEPAAGEAKKPLLFLASQRLWYAHIAAPLLDAAVVLPAGASAPPEVQTQLAAFSATEWLPITTFGVRWGDLLATASVSPRVRVKGTGATGGTLQREEYDLALGWSVQPWMTASLIYKRGEFGPATTERAAQLTGYALRWTGNGALAGVTFNAPLGESLGLYGSLAAGRGRWRVDVGPTAHERFPSIYAISEVGVNWLLGGQVSAQIGYRTQEVTWRRLTLSNYSTVQPGVETARRSARSTSTTNGPIAAASIAF